MEQSPDFVQETLSLLFWVSWFALLYLAWPRLVELGRRWRRQLAPGRPVRLLIAPARPTPQQTVDHGLRWATWIFLGLSVLELVLRRPQFERLSLPLLALCLVLTLLVRGWRKLSGAPPVEGDEIIFPQVHDNTAIGLRLLKVQDALGQLRQSAAELDRRGGIYAEVADQLRDFLDSVRQFLLTVRLEAPESALLRQAQPALIRLETLAEAFELLARLPDGEQTGALAESVVEVLTGARSGFETLRSAQSRVLAERAASLIAVLRHLYRPAP